MVMGVIVGFISLLLALLVIIGVTAAIMGTVVAIVYIASIFWDYHSNRTSENMNCPRSCMSFKNFCSIVSILGEDKFVYWLSGVFYAPDSSVNHTTSSDFRAFIYFNPIDHIRYHIWDRRREKRQKKTAANASAQDALKVFISDLEKQNDHLRQTAEMQFNTANDIMKDIIERINA